MPRTVRSEFHDPGLTSGEIIACMPDVIDVYRCFACGEPILDEQESTTIIDGQGREQQVHSACIEEHQEQ